MNERRTADLRDGDPLSEDWRARLDRAFADSADLYRDLFRLSPAPMILEDWSETRRLVEEVRRVAADDAEAYVLARPEIVRRFILSQGYILANPAMLQVNRAATERGYVEYLHVFEERMVPPIARLIADLVAGHHDAIWPEMECRAFDGSELVLRGRVFIPPGHRDTWSLAISTFEDISAEREDERMLRQAKEDAERASAAKAEFLANMSHEFRTPLNAIIGFAQVLKDEMFGPLGSERYADYVADVLESGEHLLEPPPPPPPPAKADAGRLEIEESVVDMTVLINQSLRFVRDRATRERIALQTIVPRDLPRLLADGRRLRQVLLNLLTNAVKFTPRGGRIEIAAGLARDGGMEIRIADSGVGMSAEEVAVALEPFGQVRRRHKGRVEGTGLGLPIVRSLVELHGANITLESAPGQGTRVRVRFPAQRLLPRETAPRARGGPSR